MGAFTRGEEVLFISKLLDLTAKPDSSQVSEVNERNHPDFASIAMSNQELMNADPLEQILRSMQEEMSDDEDGPGLNQADLCRTS